MISHPHYYTTYVEWVKAFNCPIYVAADDQEWFCRKPPSLELFSFIKGPVGTSQELVPSVKAIKLGGHFPGSLVLHWEKKLFIADTIVTVPVSITFCNVLSAIQLSGPSFVFLYHFLPGNLNILPGTC